MLSKKCKVVLLPTNQKAQIRQICINSIQMFEWGKEHEKQDVTNTVSEYLNTKAQHLYILSNEEIKDEQKDIYVLQIHENRVHKLSCVDVKQNGKLAMFNDDNMFTPLGNCREVIAATDSSLKIDVSYKYPTAIGLATVTKQLPQPSQSFIEKYVEEYNKGNVITDVMVEYEHNIHNSPVNLIANDGNFQLKVNPKDNTISIKRVKDSWNREEVEELIKRFTSDLFTAKVLESKLDGKKWIEENL